MKQFTVKTVEVHTKEVTHKVYAESPEDADAKVREGKAHTRYEGKTLSTEIKEIKSIKS